MLTTYNFTTTSGGALATYTGRLDDTGLINAYGVEIRWQSTDFSTAPATAVATASTGATATAGPTATNSTTSAESGLGSSRLSTGAKVGIGIGVAAPGILIIIAIGLLILRRRKHLAEPARASNSYATLSGSGAGAYRQPPGNSRGHTELSTASGPFYLHSELGSNPLYESPTPGLELVELDGGKHDGWSHK